MRREGKLSAAQQLNRLELREAMTGAGFLQLPNEWWHFDCMPKKKLFESARPVDSLDQILKP